MDITDPAKHFQIKNLRTEILIPIILIISFLAVNAFVITTVWTGTIHDAREQAVRLSLAAAAGLRNDDIRSVISEISNSGNVGTESEYLEIKGCLNAIVKLDKNIRSAYIYAKRDSTLYNLADSEPMSSADYSPPGTEYRDAPADLFHPFTDNAAFVAGPLTDSRGIWNKVLVPLKNLASGEVIAVLAVDYPSGIWNQQAAAASAYACVTTLCVFLVIIVLFFSISKNKVLKKEKAAMADMEIRIKKAAEVSQTLFNQVPVGIRIANNGRYIKLVDNTEPIFNPMFEKITGRSSEELSKINWMEYTYPDDLQKELEDFEKLNSGEIDSYSMEKRIIRPDGSIIWVHMIIAPMTLKESGEIDHICIMEDITERKEAESALAESERNKSVLLSHIQGLAYRCSYDNEWTMQYISEGCFELSGYHPENLLANRDLSFNDLIAPEYREILRCEWARNLPLKLPFRYEYEIITSTGGRKWVLEIGQGIYDSNDRVEALEGIVLDITEIKLRENQIRFMGNHDFMTGLFNRNYYDDMMDSLDSCEDCLPLSILIADINGVRFVNDVAGHAEGDLLIIRTAKLIQGCCREGYVLARTGGDEFGILMPNTSREEAAALAQKIADTVGIFNKTADNHKFDISLSVGCNTKETSRESISQIGKFAAEYMNNRKLLDHKSSHSALLESYKTTLYERSQETQEHAERIAGISKSIGEKLNLPQKSLDEIELFAMLHDIGKIGVDDRILKKPGKLTEEEWVGMKKHPEIGSRIARSSPEIENIADYILSHHERWDGKGYPRGLKGKEIPLLSRILSVADAYDAMTEDRIYREGMSREAALEEIKKNSGTQFDPEITRIFLAYI